MFLTTHIHIVSQLDSFIMFSSKILCYMACKQSRFSYYKDKYTAGHVQKIYVRQGVGVRTTKSQQLPVGYRLSAKISMNAMYHNLSIILSLATRRTSPPEANNILPLVSSALLLCSSGAVRYSVYTHQSSSDADLPTSTDEDLAEILAFIPPSAPSNEVLQRDFEQSLP